MFLAKRVSLITLLFILMFSTNIEAKFRNVETTRLQSTAGVGVGSFLMDEATQLNPAPLGFFNISSIYYQRSTAKPTNVSDSSSSAESSINSFIISDAKNSLKGSISYKKLDDGINSSKRLGFAIAAPVHKQTAMGISYRKTKNLYADEPEENYDQYSIGITHAISEHFSLGLVVVDPLQKRKEDTRALIGFQYVYKGFITIMGDAGADYNQNLSATEKYGAAIQASLFSDFYLRFGAYTDRGLSESGNGAGIGWVSPRLVLDLAVKNIKIDESVEKEIVAENIKEASFSLSYRF